jgi:hypothetical protein
VLLLAVVLDRACSYSCTRPRTYTTARVHVLLLERRGRRRASITSGMSRIAESKLR